MGESMLTGALIGAVIGAIAVVVMWIVGSRVKPSFDLKIRREASFAANMPADQALQAIQKGVAGQGLKVEMVDKPGSRMLLSEGASLMSFGHFVLVKTADAAGGSEITVGLGRSIICPPT